MRRRQNALLRYLPLSCSAPSFAANFAASFAVGSALVFAGCSSRDESAILREATAGNETAAIAAANDVYDNALASDPGGAEYTEDERLLWALQRGSLALQFERPEIATQFFDLAEEQLVGERATRVSDLFSEALLNESVGAYRGTIGDQIGASVGRAQSWWWRGRPGGDTEPVQARENALNVLRGLTNSVLKWIADSSSDYRLHDDGFSRALAALVALAQPVRTGADDAFIAAQFLNAERAYAAAAAVAAEDGKRRWEAQRPPAMDVLRWRFLQDYDPQAAAALAKTVRAAAQPLPAGHGSVVVIEDRGRRSRLEELRITVVRSPDFRTDYEGAWESVGAVFFYVGGPTGSDLSFLNFLIIPQEVSDFITNEGQVISFALPAYGPDTAVVQPEDVVATAVLDGHLTTSQQRFPSVIAQDWDAYARFQLRDEVLSRTTATLARVVAKQTISKVASDAVEKEHGQLAGLLTSFSLSLVASATEGADRRHWSLQPDHTTMTLLDLPAGRHALRAGDRSLGTVDVRPGGLQIIWRSSDQLPPAMPVPASVGAVARNSDVDGKVVAVVSPQ